MTLVLLLPLIGTDFFKGATRWISLGFISIQPSEFLKPAFVGCAAWMMAGAYDRHGPPGKTLSFVLAALCAGLLAMQPDFGQAALLLATWGAMYFVAGAPAWLLVGLGGAVAGDRESYLYLAESIRRFPPQEDLVAMMGDAGLSQVRYRNLSGGIAALHSGWKL